MAKPPDSKDPVVEELRRDPVAEAVRVATTQLAEAVGAATKELHDGLLQANRTPRWILSAVVLASLLLVVLTVAVTGLLLKGWTKPLEVHSSPQSIELHLDGSLWGGDRSVKVSCWQPDTSFVWGSPTEFEPCPGGNATSDTSEEMSSLERWKQCTNRLGSLTFSSPTNPFVSDALTLSAEIARATNIALIIIRAGHDSKALNRNRILGAESNAELADNRVKHLKESLRSLLCPEGKCPKIPILLVSGFATVSDDRVTSSESCTDRTPEILLVYEDGGSDGQ